MGPQLEWKSGHDFKSQCISVWYTHIAHENRQFDS